MILELEMRDRAIDRVLWSVIIRHIEAETAGDVQGTLDTITQDCRYVFAFEGLTMRGQISLRPYYTHLFSNWPGEVLKRRMVRYWVASSEPGGALNTILFEAENTFRLEDGTIEALPSAALLTVRGDLLAEEWIFVSHPTPWLRQVGARDADFLDDPLPIQPDMGRKSSDYALEQPYSGRRNLDMETAVNAVDPYDGSRVVVKEWFADDGSKIVLQTAPGSRPDQSTQISVLSFQDENIMQQITYSVRDRWPD